MGGTEARTLQAAGAMRVCAIGAFLCFTAVCCAKPATSVHDVREDALRRAQVWTEPATRIEDARLDETVPGPDGFAADAVVTCRFKAGGIAGSSAKFDCLLDDGHTVKVKYGRANPEVYSVMRISTRRSSNGLQRDVNSRRRRPEAGRGRSCARSMRRRAAPVAPRLTRSV